MKINRERYLNQLYAFWEVTSVTQHSRKSCLLYIKIKPITKVNKTDIITSTIQKCTWNGLPYLGHLTHTCLTCSWAKEICHFHTNLRCWSNRSHCSQILNHYAPSADISARQIFSELRCEWVKVLVSTYPMKLLEHLRQV